LAQVTFGSSSDRTTILVTDSVSSAMFRIERSLAAVWVHTVLCTVCEASLPHFVEHLALKHDHCNIEHVGLLQDSSRMIHQETIAPDCDGRLMGAPSNGMTDCPEDVWVDAMVEADPSPDKIIMDVGCNKGDDSISWLERWDPSPHGFWNTSRWRNYYDEVLIQPLPDQKAGWFQSRLSHCLPFRPVSRPATVRQLALQSKTVGQSPIAVCIEPQKENVELLHNASSTFGYGSTKYGSLKIVQAALTDHADLNETIEFPNGMPGQENLGLSSNMWGRYSSSVKLLTVDNLVKQMNLPRVDILKIDTEGWDPAVLLGASSTLSSVRYLEFEVHRDLKKTPWHSTKLKLVIDKLHDEKEFECYWAGQNGRLLSINRCWRETFEKGFWGNAACVKRTDKWASVLQRFSKREVRT